MSRGLGVSRNQKTTPSPRALHRCGFPHGKFPRAQTPLLEEQKTPKPPISGSSAHKIQVTLVGTWGRGRTHPWHSPSHVPAIPVLCAQCCMCHAALPALCGCHTRPLDVTHGTGGPGGAESMEETGARKGGCAGLCLLISRCSNGHEWLQARSCGSSKIFTPVAQCHGTAARHSTARHGPMCTHVQRGASAAMGCRRGHSPGKVLQGGEAGIPWPPRAKL